MYGSALGLKKAGRLELTGMRQGLYMIMITLQLVSFGVSLLFLIITLLDEKDLGLSYGISGLEHRSKQAII